MPIRGEDVAAAHDKHARELRQHRRGLGSEPVRQGTGGAAHPQAWTEQVGRPGRLQAKRAIMLESGVADAGDIGEACAFEKRVCLTGRRCVHERYLRPRRGDGRPRRGDIGQRLATERSTEVAEEHDERATVTRDRFERRALRILDPRHFSDATHASSFRASA